MTEIDAKAFFEDTLAYNGNIVAVARGAGNIADTAVTANNNFDKAQANIHNDIQNGQTIIGFGV